jgi:hypothetical protein
VKKGITKNNSKRAPSFPTGSYREALKLFTHREMPVPLEFIDRVADEFERWVEEDPNAFKVSQFRFKHKISSCVWNRWLKVSERLREANEFVLTGLGIKRELGGLKNELNIQMVQFAMPFYDESWERESIRRSNLTKQENAAGATQTQFVLVDKIPDSPLVKPKEEE